MSLLPDDPVEKAVFIVKVVIGVVLVGIIAYLAYTKSLLETEVAQQKTEIVQYQNANTEWKTQTAKANAALKATIDEAARRETVANKAIAVAQAKANSFLNKAKQISSVKPEGDDCAAAAKLLDTYFSAPQ